MNVLKNTSLWKKKTNGGFLTEANTVEIWTCDEKIFVRKLDG